MSGLDRSALREDLLGVLRLVLEARLAADVASDAEAPWLVVDLLERVSARLVAVRGTRGLPPATVPPAEGCG